MDRAGAWERAVLHGQVPEHSTRQAAGAEHISLAVEDVPAAGSRPDRLAGVPPRERVQQHPVDQIVDTAPALPILGVPVPLKGEQLVDVLRFFDTPCPVAEQVIDVPKILLEDVCVRTVLRDAQLVEQLVEVPTIVSPSMPVDAKEEDTIVAMASDAAGRRWFQVSGPRGHCWWWLSGSRHTQWDHPEGYTARPGRYRNTGQG